MRALAHPMRVALLEALSREGSLTATQAGDLLGESPANCSFHLRTLAEHGFVEEAPGGSGRQRPWRRVGLRTSFRLDNEEAAAVVAAQTLSRQFAHRISRPMGELGSDARRVPEGVARGQLPLRHPDLPDCRGARRRRRGDAGDHRPVCRPDRPAKRPEGAYPVAISGHGHPLEPSPSGN